jgi:hypothetical protein
VCFSFVSRFIDCENWRKQFEVDKLLREFNYEEKPQVFEYYPQYYHKTDKVWSVIYCHVLGEGGRRRRRR